VANDTHDIFRKYFYTGRIDTTNYADANHPQRLNIPESEYNILKSIYDGRENYKEKLKILLNKSIKKFFNTTPYNIIQTSGPPISYTSSNPNIKQNIKYFINKILYEFLDTTYIENKISKFIDNKYLITSEKKSITISSITKPINNNIDYHTSLNINDAVEYNGLKYSYSTANNNKIIETLFNDTIVPIDDITTITGDDYIKSKLFINKINMDNRTLHCMYIGRVNKYREDFNQLVNLYQNNLKLIDKTNIDPTNFRNIYKKKLEKLYRLFVYHLNNYFILCIESFIKQIIDKIYDQDTELIEQIKKPINTWISSLPSTNSYYNKTINTFTFATGSINTFITNNIIAENLYYICGFIDLINTTLQQSLNTHGQFATKIKLISTEKITYTNYLSSNTTLFNYKNYFWFETDTGQPRALNTYDLNDDLSVFKLKEDFQFNASDNEYFSNGKKLKFKKIEHKFEPFIEILLEFIDIMDSDIE
jgi:hypothetical protein